jgi:hypothetical protein
VRISRLAICAIAALAIGAPGRIARAQDMAAPDATATPRPMMIPDPLLVSLQAAPGYGSAPLLVGFLLNAVAHSGAQIVSYKWNFGDGHTSTLPPVMAYNTYSQPGNYVTTVTITTADGRSATGFAGIIVKPAAGTTPAQREQNQ